MTLHDHVIARDDRIRTLLERESIPIDGITLLALLTILHTTVARGVLMGEEVTRIMSEFEAKAKGGVN